MRVFKLYSVGNSIDITAINVFSEVCVSHSVHGEGGLCMMSLPAWLPDPMFLPVHGLSL